MKTLKTIILTVGAVALAGASTLSAQTKATAAIPFEFTVQNTTLPAGEYNISNRSETHSWMLIQNVETRKAILVLAPDEASLEVARAKAERRYGGEGWGMDAGGYVGTPPMVVDRIAELVEKGITTFIFFTHDRAEPRTLELFAERVMPEFS